MPFTPKAFDFLMENRLRNSREWYQQHKEVFQREVLLPMQELVRELEPFVVQVDPLFITEPRTDRTISRVYRDTRFSRDKSLYREVMWCTFKRDRNLYPGCPSLFVEVSPDGTRYGCGWYAADPSLMEIMRERVLAGDPLFLAADRALREQTLFTLQGDKYKRPRHPEAPKELWDWLDRKNVYISREEEDPQLVFSPALGKLVGERLLLLQPIYQFFLQCTLLAVEREHSLRSAPPEF